MTADDSTDTKQQLAEERTELADDRTALAYERTYAAWLRTGLAALAIGIGIERLLNKLEPSWLVMALSVAFIAIAVIIFFISMWRYRQLAMMSQDGAGRATPKWVVVLLSLLAVASAFAAVYLALASRFGESFFSGVLSGVFLEPLSYTLSCPLAGLG